MQEAQLKLPAIGLKFLGNAIVECIPFGIILPIIQNEIALVRGETPLLDAFTELISGKELTRLVTTLCSVR